MRSERSGFPPPDAMPGKPASPSQWNRTQESVRRISLSLWLWELLSLLTSASCIGAILVILAHYDGRPVPAWRFGLTINAIVSILSRIAKASIILPIAEAISQLKWRWYRRFRKPVMDFEMFDSASRGPWGSLVLLFHPRIRNLASIGAALTVAALAIEPSLQQVPAYPLQNVRSGISYTPRSTFYNESSIGTDFQNIEPGMRGAIFSGIFDENNNDTVEAICPTGNCTCPAFTSLAVCNVCTNITSFMGKYEIEDGTNLYPNPITLPTGQALWAGINITQWMLIGTMMSTVFDQSVANTVLMDLTSILTPPLVVVNADDLPVSAFECLIYPCVKKFVGSTTNGEYMETVVDSWPKPNTTVDYHGDIPNLWGCLGRGRTRTKVPCSHSLMVARPSQVVTLEPPGQNETFGIGSSTYNLMRYSLSTIMKGSYESDINTEDAMPSMYTAQLNTTQLRVLNETGAIVAIGPQRMVDRITTRMTNRIRTMAKDSPAVGEALSLHNVVRARWWWAVVPVALLVITTVFLASTITATLTGKVPIWKSSSLAPLLHGLDDSSCQAMTAQRFDHVESNARAFAMKMKLENGRWKLDGVERQCAL